MQDENKLPWLMRVKLPGTGWMVLLLLVVSMSNVILWMFTDWPERTLWGMIQWASVGFCFGVAMGLLITIPMRKQMDQEFARLKKVNDEFYAELMEKEKKRDR